MLSYNMSSDGLGTCTRTPQFMYVHPCGDNKSYSFHFNMSGNIRFTTPNPSENLILTPIPPKTPIPVAMENDECLRTRYKHKNSKCIGKEAGRRGRRRQNFHNPSTSSQAKWEYDVKLRMWDLGQCDATRCSGRKLCKVGVMREIKAGTVFSGLLLSPYGKKTVSPDVRKNSITYFFLYVSGMKEA